VAARPAPETPDFASILQAFLDRSQPADGIYEVPFILHSDTLTRLLLLLDIEYYLQQSLLAPQLSQVALPEQDPIHEEVYLPVQTIQQKANTDRDHAIDPKSKPDSSQLLGQQPIDEGKYGQYERG